MFGVEVRFRQERFFLHQTLECILRVIPPIPFRNFVRILNSVANFSHIYHRCTYFFPALSLNNQDGDVAGFILTFQKYQIEFAALVHIQP